MGTSDTVEQHYDVLSCLGGPQTPIRVAILQELNSNGSMRKSELEDIFVRAEKNGSWDFDVSKPTLHRQFEETTGENTNHSLVEKGWVKDISESRGAESRYELTPKGQLLCDELASLFGLFSLLDRVTPDLEPFLEVVTRADVGMEENVLEELTDADIYGATPTNLYGVFSEFDQFVSEADFVRGVSWVSSELFVDQFYRYVVEQDKQVELILTSEVLEQLTEQHTERWKEILETGDVEVFECDVYPFGMTVVEHGVAWGYFEPEKGAHEYELVTHSDTVQEWATEVFETYKKEGRNVTQNQLEEAKEKTETT